MSSGQQQPRPTLGNGARPTDLKLQQQQQQPIPIIESPPEPPPGSTDGSSPGILEKILAEKMERAGVGGAPTPGGAGAAPPGASLGASAAASAVSPTSPHAPPSFNSIRRSNSIDSVGSSHSVASSVLSTSVVLGIGGGDDHCLCDDCLLGINDHLADGLSGHKLTTITDGVLMEDGGAGFSKMRNFMRKVRRELKHSP